MLNFFVDLITRSLYKEWPDAGTFAARNLEMDEDYAMEKQFRQNCGNYYTYMCKQMFLERRPLNNSQNCEENYKAPDLGMHCIHLSSYDV